MIQRRTPHRFTQLLAQATLMAFLFSSFAPAAIASGNGVPLTAAEQQRISAEARRRAASGPAAVTQDASARPAAPAAERQPAPAPAPTTQNTSSMALCHTADKGAPQGLGAVVYSWPELYRGPNPNAEQQRQNAEYNRKAKEYRNEHLRKILEANTQVHRKYVTPANAQAANLKPSVEAATAYFELAYGNRAATLLVCEAKRQFSKEVTAYNAAKEQASKISAPTANACEGAFRQMYESYGAAEKAYSHYLQVINRRLVSGYPEKDDKGRERHVEALERAYHKYFSIHSLGVRDNEKKIEAVAKPDVEGVKKEFKAIWGNGTERRPDGAGPFSEVLLQLRQEKKLAEEQQKFFADEQEKFEKLKADCKTGGLTADATHRPGNEPGPGARPGAPGEEPADTTPPGRRQRPDPVVPDDGTGTGTPGGNPGAGVPDDTSGGSRPPPKKEGMSGFLKDNWMWLAGGAAVVGGGAYLYKRHQDKKRDKELNAQFAAYLNQSQNTGSSSYTSTVTSTSSTPGSGTAPAGAKLIIKNQIGNTEQGVTLSPIEVFLVDANGVPIKDNDIAIEASCYVPQPCSLTGGKSVTTIDGAATFNSLSFTQAHQGVRLQFSAPGVPTVTTPNTIDVSPNNSLRQ
jgi:hypothetical protein